MGHKYHISLPSEVSWKVSVAPLLSKTSQSLVVPSQDPDTRRARDGQKERELTGPSCPVNNYTTIYVGCQTRIMFNTETYTYVLCHVTIMQKSYDSSPLAKHGSHIFNCVM